MGIWWTRCSIQNCLTFKDQKSVNALRHQLSDLSWKIDVDVQPVYTSQKIKGKIKPKEHEPPIVNQQNVAYYFKCGQTVWCRLSQHHESILTSTCGGAQAINNQQPHKGWARKGSGERYKQFQNLKKVSEQTWLFDLWNALYSWTQTKTEQAVWLDPCEAIYFIITVKPLLSRHLRDLPKCLLNRGCPLNGGCKSCAMFVSDQHSTVTLYCDKVACC